MFNGKSYIKFIKVNIANRMEENMKLLMITSRNIDKNGGENALIIGRHTSLFKEYGIETDVIFFHKDTTKEYGSNYSGIKFISCTEENKYTKIKQLISTGQYQGIVSSGFYDNEFVKFVRLMKERYNLAYILDIHATIKEIYEYCIPDLYHIIGTRYLYLLKRRRLIKTLKIIDYAFVVSETEIEETNRYYKNNNIKYLLVRCGCYDTLNVEVYYKTREEYRKHLEIDNDALAFVYSGSKDRWQKFEETLKTFKMIKETGIKCKFAFYMNLSEEDKHNINEELGKENVTIRWVAPEQMKKELMAYDVGMLLRDSNWTNKVAFPNKYSDYIASGLHLCVSKALTDPYKIALNYKLKLVDLTNIEKSLEEIQYERKNELDNYLQMCKKIIDNELLYDIQVKNNCKSLYQCLKVIEKDSYNE